MRAEQRNGKAYSGNDSRTLHGTSRLQKGKYQGEYSLIADRSSQTEPRKRNLMKIRRSH